jgi:isopentenyl-diphosphate delta-isomerase type 1
MEVIDVVNERDEVIGVKDKDAVHRDGDFHRAARIYVVNSNGEILVHKRAATKKLNPDLWDVTVGGHVHSGETYEDAAKRELEEELGIRDNGLIEIGKWMGHPNASSPLERLMVKIFLAKFDGNAEELAFDKVEISNVKFVGIPELEKICENKIERKKFVYMGDFKERLKTIKKFIG